MCIEDLILSSTKAILDVSVKHITSDEIGLRAKHVAGASMNADNTGNEPQVQVSWGQINSILLPTFDETPSRD